MLSWFYLICNANTYHAKMSTRLTFMMFICDHIIRVSWSCFRCLTTFMLNVHFTGHSCCPDGRGLIHELVCTLSSICNFLLM